MLKERIVHGSHGGENHAIQAEAAVNHGITSDIAFTEGICIKMAMEDLMTDVLDIVRKGGRLWGHHLGFHGYVIERQLERLGMYALQKVWGDILREGVCLMDPMIGNYVKENCNETCSHKPSELSLSELLRRLLPDYFASQTRAPTAIENAAACLRIGRCLQELVLPPCRREGGCHTYTRVYPTCMRDNGEWTEECTECRSTRT